MKELLFFQKEASPLRRLLMLKAVAGGIPLSEYTATGNPLTFDTNIAKPLKSLVIPWTPTQSGTGDPSPENVRPISGVSGVTAWHTGKNLYDYDASKITQETTSSSTTRAVYHTGLKNGKYTLSGSLKEGQTAIAYGANYGKFANNVATVSGNFIAPNSQYATDRTITVGADEEVIFMNPSDDIADLNSKLVRYNIQIELGETASEYSPYTGETVSVAFPALGKNLFDLWANGYWSSTSKAWINSSPGAVSKPIKVKTGDVVTISQDNASANYQFIEWDKSVEQPSDYTADDCLAFVRSTDGAPRTYTVQHDCYLCAFVNIGNDTFASRHVQLEKGNQSTAYEPYTNTVYGGSLDVTTGVLTVEWKAVHFIGSDFGFTTGADSPSAPYRAYSDIITDAEASSVNVISDKFKASSPFTFYPKPYECDINDSRRVIFGVPSDYSTRDAMRSWIDGLGGVDFAYKLATAQTVQLTPPTGNRPYRHKHHLV